MICALHDLDGHKVRIRADVADKGLVGDLVTVALHKVDRSVIVGSCLDPAGPVDAKYQMVECVSVGRAGVE